MLILLQTGEWIVLLMLGLKNFILAAKDPLLYKVLPNEMRESEQRHVTPRINASEEAVLMELLNFMYSNAISATTAPALLDVMMATNKFEVASCMRYCSRLLRHTPMSPDLIQSELFGFDWNINLFDSKKVIQVKIHSY